ncbi:MAG: cbb3-type cytochrome c oxidase subunit 3 [Gemmatimonadaceae bacterium]|jgi:cbb3-type cytochrome oxidase subunit 3|nr:cbb3-type cytochrome c oxidase subunit 3 [Gemmatimonadaceae bacterium]
MKLSDVVANAGLAIYAQIALVLFLAVFVAVAWRVFRPSRKADLESAGGMALHDAPQSDSPTSRLGAIA